MTTLAIMNVQLICETCGHLAKRALIPTPGSRGTHETASEPATCPHGHGPMVRKDGVVQVDGVVVGRRERP